MIYKDISDGFPKNICQHFDKFDPKSSLYNYVKVIVSLKFEQV